jgi:monofunctional biosynthetic peptidoglycan transglycosylase
MTAMMNYQLGVDYAKNIKIDWAAYEEISSSMKRALVAAEDDRFMQHSGIDIRSIKDAYFDNLHQKNKRGGSTISQQLVKNLFLSPAKNIYRKINEAALVIFLEMFLSKKRILELYLNIAEWGDGLYGIKNASQFYFNVDPNSLSSYQSAKLASMLTNPKKYQKDMHSDFLIKKTNQIFMRMDYSSIP